MANILYKALMIPMKLHDEVKLIAKKEDITMIQLLEKWIKNN